MKLRNPRFQGSILDFSNRRKSRPKEKRIKKVAHCLEDKIPKNNFVLDFHQSSMMGLMKLLSIGFHTFFFGSYWYPGCVESLAEKQSPRHILPIFSLGVGEINSRDRKTLQIDQANQHLPDISRNRFHSLAQAQMVTSKFQGNHCTVQMIDSD